MGEYNIYWLLKSSCFDLFGNGEYGLFWAKKLMERWYWLVTEAFLFWTFRWCEIRSSFQAKTWWKDGICLVFLLYPWYSRTWEIWLFAQCIMHIFTSNFCYIFAENTFKFLGTQSFLYEFRKFKTTFNHFLCIINLQRI